MFKRFSKKSNALAWKRSVTGYLFMLPWIAGFLVFTAVPFIYTIYLSFFEVKLTVLGYELTYNGIGNYILALFRNVEFVPGLLSFLLMEVIYTPVIVILSFILALLLNRPMKLRSVFRMLFFLPVIVMSGPVMSQIMESGAAAITGIESLFIYSIVQNYSPWLANALLYLFENFSMVLWFTGIPIILFINGLQKINGSVIEAATIDSATSWQILWKITIPILRPLFVVITIFTVVQLSLFHTNPVSALIQRAIILTVGGLGLASAFAWIYSLVLLLFIGLAFVVLKEPKEQTEQYIRKQDRRWLGK